LKFSSKRFLKGFVVVLTSLISIRI